MARAAQASDLLVHPDGEPEPAGIPVSPRPEVARAKPRFLLTEARWKEAE